MLQNLDDFGEAPEAEQIFAGIDSGTKYGDAVRWRRGDGGFCCFDCVN